MGSKWWIWSSASLFTSLAVSFSIFGLSFASLLIPLTILLLTMIIIPPTRMTTTTMVMMPMLLPLLLLSDTSTTTRQPQMTTTPTLLPGPIDWFPLLISLCKVAFLIDRFLCVYHPIDFSSFTFPFHDFHNKWRLICFTCGGVDNFSSTSKNVKNLVFF